MCARKGLADRCAGGRLPRTAPRTIDEVLIAGGPAAVSDAVQSTLLDMGFVLGGEAAVPDSVRAEAKAILGLN